MTSRKNVVALMIALAFVAGSVVSCDNWAVESIIGGKKTDEKTSETGTNSGNGGGVTPNTPVNVPVKQVVISPSGDLGGVVRGFMPLIATVYPPDATNKGVIWESSDESIVAIGKDSGLVTLMNFKEVSAEDVTITVKTVEGNFTDSRKVKVVEQTNVVSATGVNITGSPPAEGFVGGYLQLMAKVTPPNATNQGVEWESSDPDKALVAGGLVILLKETEEVTITAKAGGVSTPPHKIKIKPVPVPVNLPAVDMYVYMPGDTIKVGDIWSSVLVSDIRVDPFHIGKTEVRYELWYIVKEWGVGHGYIFQNKGQAGSSGVGGPGAFPVSPDKDEPVTMVNWRDVVIWCNAYSEITGKDPVYYADDEGTTLLKDSRDANGAVVDGAKQLDRNGYRLPTGNEWEYAARGGNPSDVAWAYTYAGSNSPSGVAWYSTSTTHSVGQKEANSAGLYDMSGNVIERCFELYNGGPTRMVRGGSWLYGDNLCTVAMLAGTSAKLAYYSIGFRVVCR